MALALRNRRFWERTGVVPAHLGQGYGCSNSPDVSAAYEVPELTVRSAQKGFPGALIDAFHGLPWQGREAAAA
jgi:hypothetical protein